MPKPALSQVVTGSDLLLGDVVYLTENDEWTRHLDHAERITDEAHAQLRLLFAVCLKNSVVGAYLTDVPPEPAALHFREAFRATGPSNYAHGKQEGVLNV